MQQRPTATHEPPAWDARSLRKPHQQTDKADRVQRMFDEIAPTYELVNRIVSLRRDATWRRRAVAAADLQPSDTVLDICCGTGDMLRTFAALSQPPRLLIGLDFAAEMLARGQHDRPRTHTQLLRADALRLPVADDAIDVITCAFGVRNFQDLGRGLLEMHRVLRTGGRVVILEFALPENPLIRWGYRLYCERILPRAAALISRDRSGAYRYLPNSIRTFERRGAMQKRLADVGFRDIRIVALNLGGVVIYRGLK